MVQHNQRESAQQNAVDGERRKPAGLEIFHQESGAQISRDARGQRGGNGQAEDGLRFGLKQGGYLEQARRADHRRGQHKGEAAGFLVTQAGQNAADNRHPAAGYSRKKGEGLKSTDHRGGVRVPGRLRLDRPDQLLSPLINGILRLKQRLTLGVAQRFQSLDLFLVGALVFQ